jgi:hypothetical protein
MTKCRFGHEHPDDDGGQCYEFEVDQDEKSGKWTGTCPFCKFKETAFTEKGMMRRVITHLNTEHKRLDC